MAKQDLYSYGDEFYTIEGLKSGEYTIEQMRQEYSRLRVIANSRLNRFKGTEFEDSQAYLKNVGKFPRLSEIRNERELMHKLIDVKKFTSSKTGSVSGIRDIINRTVETAHDRGMDWLNKGNIKQFGEYMEHLRALHKGRQFDSERAQRLFGVAVQKEIDPQEIAEDYAYWSKNEKGFAKMPKIQSEDKKSASDYKKALEAKKKKKKR